MVFGDVRGMGMIRVVPIAPRIDVRVRFARKPERRHELVVKPLDRDERGHARVDVIDPKKSRHAIPFRQHITAGPQFKRTARPFPAALLVPIWMRNYKDAGVLTCPSS